VELKLYEVLTVNVVKVCMEIDYRKIERSAKAYAAKQGYSNESEDFAQEVLLYAFQKETEKVYIKNRFIDYLRKTKGDARNKCHKDRVVSLSNDFDAGIIEDEKERRESKICLNPALVLNLSADELFILKLSEQGWQYKEIAFLYGVSDSRISQRMTELRRKAR
jgi:RNA polymerase sigma factor (sigma-70 family)